MWRFDFEDDDDLALLALLEDQRRAAQGGGINTVGVPRIIFEDLTDHAFVAPGPTTLITISIPLGSLRLTGDFLEYVAEFDLAANANSKTIAYAFGGQNINGNPWNNTLGNTQMAIIGRVYRTSPTTCRSYQAASLPFATQTFPFTQFTDITVANMNNNTLNFTVIAQGVASNDIIHRASHMFIIQN
jgi:hypothetical protein